MHLAAEPRGARGQLAGRRGGQQRGEIFIEHRQHHLRLGIAKPHVELDDPRSLLREHEPDVEEPSIRMSLAPHAFEDRPHDRVDHAPLHVGRDQRARRKGTHPAGIRPAVVVEDALVILRGLQRHERRAVGEHEVRRFLARQKFLEDHALAGGAELSGDHHVADHGFRGRAIVRDHDAFARGEAVGLDDQRVAELAPCDLAQRRVGRVADAETRGRYAMAGHEILRERLARLQPRRASGGTDNRKPVGVEEIDDAAAEGNLRTDNGQVNLLAHGDREKVVRLTGVGGDTARDGGDAWVPRRADDAPYCTLSRELPRKRMLSSTTANDENFHGEER